MEKKEMDELKEADDHYMILENDALILGNAIETLLDKMAIQPPKDPKVYVTLVENHIEIGRFKGTVELIR